MQALHWLYFDQFTVRSVHDLILYWFSCPVYFVNMVHKGEFYMGSGLLQPLTVIGLPLDQVRSTRAEHVHLLNKHTVKISDDQILQS